MERNYYDKLKSLADKEKKCVNWLLRGSCIVSILIVLALIALSCSFLKQDLSKPDGIVEDAILEPLIENAFDLPKGSLDLTPGI